MNHPTALQTKWQQHQTAAWNVRVSRGCASCVMWHPATVNNYFDARRPFDYRARKVLRDKKEKLPLSPSTRHAASLPCRFAVLSSSAFCCCCTPTRKVSMWNCKMIEQLAFVTSSMISVGKKLHGESIRNSAAWYVFAAVVSGEAKDGNDDGSVFGFWCCIFARCPRALFLRCHSGCNNLVDTMSVNSFWTPVSVIAFRQVLLSLFFAEN